ncbi:hypothetical protein [Marinivivus vitaminiproducens]|uniref:hypothetical protein n=1 Tax=Marinivivus vitaminiproducens TaxID=3035935 RepID=UPI0027A1FF29|nr:hypothetical protein P4R82_14445 [Geminicoccaceae bacterium SCSIO 64248]
MTNPFLSAWLSMANTMAGPIRGFWTAEFHRQQAAMIDAMNKQIIDFWTGALLRPQTRPHRRGQR